MQPKSPMDVPVPTDAQIATVQRILFVFLLLLSVHALLVFRVPAADAHAQEFLGHTRGLGAGPDFFADRLSVSEHHFPTARHWGSAARRHSRTFADCRSQGSLVPLYPCWTQTLLADCWPTSARLGGLQLGSVSVCEFCHSRCLHSHTAPDVPVSQG